MIAKPISTTLRWSKIIWRSGHYRSNKDVIRSEPWSNMTGVLIKRGNLDRGRHTHREDDVKTGRMPSIRQRMPEFSRSWERRWNRFTLKVIRGNQHPRHFDLGLLDSRAVRQYMSVVEATCSVLFCYGSPSKVIHRSKPRRRGCCSVLHLLMPTPSGAQY